MATRFVNVDRNTPMPLPPDLRDWIGEDDLVHFVIEAVDRLRLEIFQVNYRDISVRYLTADTHPDHDTICTFRWNNFTAISEAFVDVLELAKEVQRGLSLLNSCLSLLNSCPC